MALRTRFDCIGKRLSATAALVFPDALAKIPEKLRKLWQVGEAALLTALTTRVIATAGDRIVKRLSAAAAAESRDALAKNLYARLFDWLVAAINRKISALGSGRRSSRTIGILDIYGFESFQVPWL